MEKTLISFDAIVKDSKEIFRNKLNEYGSSWRIFRIDSLTDQIFIKILRIRNIQEKNIQKIKDESITDGLMAILNYSIIGLIQIKKPSTTHADMKEKEAISAYEDEIAKIRELMKNKNHDYDEAWRLMKISSLTDMILQKILRLKHIQENQKDVSILNRKIEEQYVDIVNYAIFLLIREKEGVSS